MGLDPGGQLFTDPAEFVSYLNIFVAINNYVVRWVRYGTYLII
jgi:hypothetical protein